MTRKIGTIQKTCQNCGKSFETGRKDTLFCSNKCKLALKRVKRAGGTVSPTPDKVQKNTGLYKEPQNVSPTKTDQLFVDDIYKREGWKNWYKFDKEVHDRKCWECGKLFQTRLRLNRYCSPKCRDEAMIIMK